MKRFAYIAIVAWLCFLTLAGCLYILGDALMRQGAEIQRLQEELRECRE